MGENQHTYDIIAGGSTSESRRKSKASLGEGGGGVLPYIQGQVGPWWGTDGAPRLFCGTSHREAGLGSSEPEISGLGATERALALHPGYGTPLGT